MAETNRERQKRLKEACQPVEPIQPPPPEQTGEPTSVSLKWLLELADFNQRDRISGYIHRQDWSALNSYLKTTASTAVLEEWQARAYPPTPQIFHGEHPKLTTADYVRGKPLWKSIPVTLAELEAEAERKRREADELVFPPEVEI